MDERVRELLDRVRGTAVTVGEAAGVTARYAGKCAGQMVDIAKLNMKIFDLRAEISALLREIGQVVYDTHLGAETDKGSVDGMLAEIDEKNKTINELKERIAVLKSCRECPGCGGPCGKEDRYCKACGAQL